MEENANQALEHIYKLLRDNRIPELSEELESIPLLKDIHDDLKSIREIVYSFSTGNLLRSINTEGIIPDCLKAFQSMLQHLIRQVRLVEKGDFSQRLEYLGDFADAFNRMIEQLDATLKEFRQKEDSLQKLAEKLRGEVDRRNSTVAALQKSESQFKYLASHDPLTGVMNRRSFMERASLELENEALLKTPCGIIMMDIDFFKNFNDTYGHLAGDEALRHVVRVIGSLLRKNDFLGRYGGEEFVVLFSNADEAMGVQIAERVRKAVQHNPVHLENGPAAITASFGVAAACSNENQGGSYIEVLISNADSALYQAKHEGRNKVVCYKVPAAQPATPM
ncbi:MAG: diguanylate cyclase [Treponema sp.]|jgi:diguanylate cyclase (GGDEF)-like protein|nr:diguanylate cyclase [Treponema sp.]